MLTESPVDYSSAACCWAPDEPAGLSRSQLGSDLPPASSARRQALHQRPNNPNPNRVSYNASSIFRQRLGWLEIMTEGFVVYGIGLCFNVDLMLGQRRRRWANNKSTLGHSIFHQWWLEIMIESPMVHGMRLWLIVGLMLGQRRRRWTNIKSTLGHCVVFIDEYSYVSNTANGIGWVNVELMII